MTTSKKNKSIREYPESIQNLINREDEADFKIVVGEIKTLSPQLKELNDYLKIKPTFMSGGLCSIKKDGIAIHVSFKLKQRALFILDALAKAFIKRGFKFGVVDKYKLYDDNDRDFTIIEINNIQIKLKLREKQNRKTIKNLKDIQDENVRNSHQYSFKAGKSYLIPNGIFCFSVDAYTFNPCTSKWEDEENLPIENQLNKLIQDLIIISEEIRLRDLHFEEQRKQEQVQNEIKRQKEQEEKSFQKRMDIVKELGMNSLIYEQVKKLKSNFPTQEENHIEFFQWIDEYLATQDPMKIAINKKTQQAKIKQY